MATLSEIAISVQTKLEYEAGSNDYWELDEIKTDINDLYKTICRETEILKTRDMSVLSVVDQQDYEYPLSYNIISLLGVDYDNKPIYPVTLEELYAFSRTWRDDNSGTPSWYFFEEGQEFSAVSLYPTPDTKDNVIAMRFSYQATTLEDTSEPEQLFKDGLVLENGTLSLELGKEGEGQNLERSEFYWNRFISDLSAFAKKPKMKERVHVFRSVEDVGLVRGIKRLPSNYPA